MKLSEELIRVGARNDGGYILPKVLYTSSIGLLSLGVGDNWQFEEQWKRDNPSSLIHSYDGTIHPEEWSEDQRAKFNRVFSGNAVFFPLNIAAKESQATRSFRSAMDSLHAREVFVKIDIEGGEYFICEQILNARGRVPGLVIEYHYTSKLRDYFVSQLRSLLDFYTLVHLHANNGCQLAFDGFPTVIEITLVRSDLIQDDRTNEIRNHSYLPGVDSPCTTSADEIEIYFE